MTNWAKRGQGFGVVGGVECASVSGCKNAALYYQSALDSGLSTRWRQMLIGKPEMRLGI
jgi:hypothetical protein